MANLVFDNLSLAGLALAFIILMAAWAVVRGAVKLVLAMITLGIGFAVGTWAFIHAPTWLEGMVELPSGRLLAAISIIAGAVGHLGSRYVIRKLSPSFVSEPGRKMSSLKAVLLSLLPSVCFLWIAGTLLRLGGSMSGLAHIDEKKVGTRSWLVAARQSLSSGFAGKFFEATDPITKATAVRLCEVLVNLRVHEHHQHLRGRPDYQRLLAQPNFQRLVNDREVKRAIAFSDYARLLTLPEVRVAAQDRQIASALAGLPDMEVRRAERLE
ncbi:MAG: hypothetical protein ACR2OZ_13375 [Verrucomicrobiales bacterium]